MKSPLVLAYYLPQYHPIPENNEWWGEGFTEWTNVRRAKPLFPGHKQPIIPGELGYYNLMDKNTQIRQSELASEYGIDGFIYYHYWFGNGKMLLEKPAEQMLKTPEIKVPFCFSWANESWVGVWYGLSENKALIEQTYSGKEGYVQHFKYLLPFFKDERYIKINNKPLFYVYRFSKIPDPDLFIKTFNELAVEAGFDGIYLIVESDTVVATQYEEIYGWIGSDVFQKMRYSKGYIFNVNTLPGRIERRLLRMLGYSEDILKRKKPLKFDYVKGVAGMNVTIPHNKFIPCVFPNWDNSPRSGMRSMIFHNANPQAWKIHFEKAYKQLLANPQLPGIIIIKSWNEWGEGNYLEPDETFGTKWLEATREVIDKYKNKPSGK